MSLARSALLEARRSTPAASSRSRFTVSSCEILRFSALYASGFQSCGTEGGQGQAGSRVRGERGGEWRAADAQGGGGLSAE